MCDYEDHTPDEKVIIQLLKWQELASIKQLPAVSLVGTFREKWGWAAEYVLGCWLCEG